MSNGKRVRCPKCDAELPEDTIEQLLKKEEKEMGFLLLGVVLGAVLGLVGSLWVSFLFEALRNLIPQAQWLISSVIGLAVTTVVSIYVLIKMLRYATRRMEGEAKGIKIEG
jgi:uncharacterized membrane protein YeaQ/YmgE (transglycosylase-associated protein family)